MKVFIVYAHREPKSFNGALTEAAIAAFDSYRLQVNSRLDKLEGR